MPTFCSQCGTTLQPDAKFCEECGAVLTGATGKSASRPAKSSKHRLWLWLVVGGWVILPVMGGLVFALQHWFDNKRANQLFVEASQLVHTAQEAEQTSYAEAFKLYQAALANLDKITTHYPSSQVAVQLTSGQAKIEAYTLAEFREVVHQAEVRAGAEGNPLTCALFVAKTIKGLDTKVRALAETSRSYVQAGEKSKAEEIFSQALQIINDASEKHLVVYIASICAEVGQCDTVLQAAKIMENDSDKVWALREIARAYAEAGHYDQALQIAGTMNADDKAGALRRIAGGSATTGRYDQALRTANTIEHTIYKALALEEIAGSYAKAGQYDQALQIARTIEDASIKTRVLAEIASKYAQAGERKKATEILSQVIQGRPSLEDFVLKEIAGAYAEAGQYDQALQIARTIEDAYDKTWALTEIATQYSQAGEKTYAAKVLSEALQVATTVTNMHPKTGVFHEMMAQCAETGQYDLILQIGNTIDDASVKVSALVLSAVAYAQAGQYDQALQVVNTIENADFKASTLSSIARTYAQGGRKGNDSTRKLLGGIIRSLDDRRIKN